MARVVHKFRVQIDGDWHVVPLPKRATIIHVGNIYPQKYDADALDWALHFWVEVIDERSFEVDREFRVFGTGEPITDPAAMWAGTFIEDGFVWHLYMREV